MGFAPIVQTVLWLSPVPWKMQLHDVGSMGHFSCLIGYGKTLLGLQFLCSSIDIMFGNHT